LQEVADAFVKARLLTTSEIAGTTTIEVSHEALIREWPRLAGWLREAREDIRLQQTLSEDVTGWEQRGKPKDRLYRGSQLKDAQGWARRNVPNKKEVTFLQASAAQQTLSLVGLILVALLLASSIGIAGWYVFFQPKPTLVTTLQDNEVGSLRWCINNAPSGSTIKFAQGVSGTIELTGGDLVFAGGKQLTIAGPGANQLAISGGNLNANIRVSEGAMVTISGLSLKNSETIVDAFLFNQGILTVANSVISGNKTASGTTSFGGGIDNLETGTLTVANSVISNNSSIGDQNGTGGGIDNEGKLTVIHSTFTNNKASGSNGFGGGIANFSTGTLTVTTSTFTNNKASGSTGKGQGGGIENEGKLTVIHSTFSNNSAGGSNGLGGGIYNHSTGTLTVANSVISNNLSISDQKGGGGGIYNAGTLTLSSSTVSNNYVGGSNGYGGGIDNRGKLTVASSLLSYNTASGSTGNGQGGGIENNDGSLTVVNSTFTNNKASGYQDGYGGGIDNYQSSVIIRFCTIYSNTSKEGGGISPDSTNGSQTNISNSIIAANSAQDGPDISGTLISGGYNLIENVAGAKGLNARTDRQVNLADLKINPTLGNNGGPTQTLALLPGSPAIDAVPLDACHVNGITTDQRGMMRPDDDESTCDTGAYEYVDASP
jgi:hypothetical protein